jgi:hypothetical protein
MLLQCVLWGMLAGVVLCGHGPDAKAYFLAVLVALFPAATVGFLRLRWWWSPLAISLVLAVAAVLCVADQQWVRASVAVISIAIAFLGARMFRRESEGFPQHKGANWNLAAAARSRSKRTLRIALLIVLVLRPGFGSLFTWFDVDREGSKHGLIYSGLRCDWRSASDTSYLQKFPRAKFICLIDIPASFLSVTVALPVTAMLDFQRSK